jgi:DMSO/TMAO reductase YedYZ molybdopterin-dependent catalytic subunit
MSKLSRRKLIAGGAIAAAGAGGLAVAAKLAHRYGLVPPDAGGIYGPGETLTYAAQRLLTKHSMAREFSRSQICGKPLQNGVDPLGDEFARLQKANFTDWRLTVDGTVGKPTTFSLAELRSFPRHSHITMIQCEEGWSYIAEWAGVPLSQVLTLVGAAPQATHVVYRSFQKDWWESMDMADALHPQTLLALEMNGGELPVGFGGPVRMRVTRQLGYKSLKYVTHLTVTDNIKQFGKGLGSASPEAGYAWYAGI